VDLTEFAPRTRLHRRGAEDAERTGGNLGVLGASAVSRPSGGAVRLLFVGRCVEQKGLPVLLDALGCLRATRGLPPVQLDVVGDGPRRQAWQAQAGRLGLADQVQFHGWAARPALPAWYRRAHLFVFPSFEEGMPNALLEALASGLPLLATDIYGNRALVRPGENGLLVPPGDAAALAQALATLLADPAGRAAMGQASRRLATQYGWAAVAEAYHALLRSAQTRW
jgi:glycosyltransferase involved in cell wall biosynthesis